MSKELNDEEKEVKIEGFFLDKLRFVRDASDKKVQPG